MRYESLKAELENVCFQYMDTYWLLNELPLAELGAWRSTELE